MNRTVHTVSIVLYEIAAAALTLLVILDRGLPAAWQIALSLLIPLGFPLVRRLFRVRQGLWMECLWLWFFFLAFTVGVGLQWYARFTYYDIFVHGLSGMLTALTGITLYIRLRPADRRLLPPERGLAVGTAFLTAQAVAGLWEIAEYVAWLITGHDSQNVATTGVSDTMEDMMIALACSLIICVCAALHYGGHRCPLLHPVDEWLEAERAAAQEEPHG